MTEKTAYIIASIKLLEKRDELNSDELAVLCNLKKFMYQSNHQPDLDIENNNNSPTLWSQIMNDHQPAFAVGEYYADHHAIYKITAINKVTVFFKLHDASFKRDRSLDILLNASLHPATVEQIATFKRAKQFAAKGRKVDEFEYGDEAEICGVTKTVIDIDDSHVTFADGTVIKKDNQALKLIQTAEELQEVEESQ
ncbi:hypothetical protein [Enterococcus sp. AZ126]|uniref:hypothetical protein n=1 Tax=Enterococcus sp. AZ126 TaxID=2774635 RepID=UPI003F27C7D1